MTVCQTDNLGLWSNLLSVAGAGLAFTDAVTIARAAVKSHTGDAIIGYASFRKARRQVAFRRVIIN